MALGEIKPWRCNSCSRLMYSIEYVEDRAVPSRNSAPYPLYISSQYPEVCSLCYEMYKALDNIKGPYWLGTKSTKPLTPDKTLDESLKGTLSQW